MYQEDCIWSWCSRVIFIHSCIPLFLPKLSLMNLYLLFFDLPALPSSSSSISLLTLVVFFGTEPWEPKSFRSSSCLAMYCAWLLRSKPTLLSSSCLLVAPPPQFFWSPPHSPSLGILRQSYSFFKFKMEPASSFPLIGTETVLIMKHGSPTPS